MNQEGNDPLIGIYRGDELETVHCGSVAVVNAAGETLYTAGDPGQRVFLRSGAKPFQVLPLIESGAAERFGFSEREIAVMVGSHGGEPMHIEVVASILEKAGISPDRLQCGIHPPFHRESARKLIREDRPADILMNNCSGKHAGMLALARHLDEDLDRYTEIGHRVQELCREAVATICAIPEEDLVVARDGCSVPTFSLPLTASARGYARLREPNGVSGSRAAALRRVADAMTRHPELVGGSDRVSTGLMQAFADSLIAKDGAEGFFGVAVPGNPGGIGIALKMADGDSGTSRAAAVLEVLRQIAAVSAEPWQAAWDRWVPGVTTLRGETVGRVASIFTLKRP